MDPIVMSGDPYDFIRFNIRLVTIENEEFRIDP